MGPSGSGKTTLLDLLAGRKTVGKTEGSILFAGNKPTRPFPRRYTGYVEQFGENTPAGSAAVQTVQPLACKHGVEGYHQFGNKATIAQMRRKVKIAQLATPGHTCVHACRQAAC
jgi:ABC-type multidrug transport system ATPase subunit